MDNDPGKNILNGVREVTSLIVRLSEKIKDRYFWTHREIEQAIGYLIYFRDALRKQKSLNPAYENIFGESGEFFEIKHFKRSFNSKSITFKTIVGQEVKKWVLKIGHRISPVIDLGDPSSPDYSKQRKKHLEVLRNKILNTPQLQYLLPEPQEIMWAILTEDGNTVGTTLILQPFMRVVKPDKIRKKLTDEQRKKLLNEFEGFKKLCTGLQKDHKLQPDLLGEGNLEIIEIGNEYHLMLLDLGLVNMQAPLPITNTIMYFASVQTLHNVENLIKDIL